MEIIKKYETFFNDYLNNNCIEKEPNNLYEPINYILSIGGKRLRPLVILMSADVLGDKLKDALPAALSVEIFHNFTLMHDDIMDNAPLRRGQTTVHEKWDVNTAILSGDTMLVQSYKCLEKYSNTPQLYTLLSSVLSKTAIEVCEGQQYDIDFVNQNTITIEDYIKMITLKTAVLVACAFKMGAIIAGVTDKTATNLYEFGKNLGIAFQLQDDYLDTFGDSTLVGKQTGGDIIENKKTYLYIKSLQELEKDKSEELFELFQTTPKNPEAKIERAKQLFEESGSVVSLKQTIDKYTKLALQNLKELDIAKEKKAPFEKFAQELMFRNK